MAAPFQSPDDSYFHQLENKLHRIPTWQSPTFRTPEGYFDGLEVTLLTQTEASTPKTRALWPRWAAAAAVLFVAGGYYLLPSPSSPWRDFSNEDIVIYLEEHQTNLPIEEMASQVDMGTLVPLHEITDQDVAQYDEVHGI